MFELRFYSNNDYPELKKLYQDSGWFDIETDTEERINQQIESDQSSILVALEDHKIVGTTTLLFTVRLGLFFRFIASKENVRRALLDKGEEIFRENGYKEVHILAQEENTSQHKAYEDYGFTKGRLYRWFWKKIK